MTCTIDVHLVLESEMSLSEFTNSLNKSSENVQLEIVEICHLKKLLDQNTLHQSFWLVVAGTRPPIPCPTWRTSPRTTS